ncbi:MAG TPA: GatB/YqeY domain-containing protein [Gammaproteobacteria bacterium]|nr:GatB/YqeY domain-containing protein [Gammaproteobacteria bacterium]
MALKESIMADMQSAMREKDSTRLNAIRLLRAALQRREVDERETLDDEGVLGIIQKMIKQSRDAITQFESGQRNDLVEKELSLILVLQQYLPQQLDEAAITESVDAAISELGASGLRDMGKVMGQLKAQLQGRADMGQVSTLVKEKLAG